MSLIKPHNPVIIGQLGKPYGVKGYLHCRSFTQPATNLQQYNEWFLQDQRGQWQHKTVEHIKPHGDHFVVRLQGFQSPESARAACNMKIAVERASLPPIDDSEFYWHDLMGAAVYTIDETLLGQLNDIQDIAGQTTFSVKIGNGKRTLIPNRAPFVQKIDCDSKRITVDWTPLEP